PRRAKQEIRNAAAVRGVAGAAILGGGLMHVGRGRERLRDRLVARETKLALARAQEPIMRRLMRRVAREARAVLDRRMEMLPTGRRRGVVACRSRPLGVVTLGAEPSDVVVREERRGRPAVRIVARGALPIGEGLMNVRLPRGR